MKRMIILPVALLLLTAAHAQTEISRKSFSVGPVIGIGHSWMSPVANSEYKPSMIAGVFAIYSPVEHWGIGMDVRYSVEGSKREFPETGVITQEFHYLRVPVRAMYFFNAWGDDFRPKIAVGPSMGFLIAHDAPSFTSENKFDFGVTASGGFNYRIYRGTWLNADVGCYHGLTDVVQHTESRELHRNIMLNVGIGLEI
jgi:hypothetical protein